MKELRYDDENDVLRIDVESRVGSFGCEEYDGLVVFRNGVTDKVVGFLVYDFFARYESKSLPSFPDGVCINVERDILPFVQ